MSNKQLRSIKDLGNLDGKKVLVRSDFNVPLDGTKITDDGRIKASLPTIKTLLDANAQVIICAHLGRPKGTPEEKYSLKPVAKRLSELSGVDVVIAEDTVGDSANEAVKNMKNGDIVLLENLRFNPGETSKDEAERGEFAKQLAGLADVYISDGFGVVHRKQASVYDVAKLLPSAAGLLVEKEIVELSKVTDNPEHPYIVVLGGAKVSDKLNVIENLLPKADTILIGGGMSYTFLKSQGYDIGTSLLEEDMIDTAKRIVEESKEGGAKVVLPVDVVMAEEFDADAGAETADVDALEKTEYGAKATGMDVGERTSELFAKEIAKAKTIFWNGPLGVFEFKKFANGTTALAEAIKDSDAFSVIGGGDSASAVRNLGFADSDFGHISTGGGASLELLEGKELPGIAVLQD
ncbi:MAG: phosphoglycerate kinase [Micrococcaceae bacterium]